MADNKSNKKSGREHDEEGSSGSLSDAQLAKVLKAFRKLEMGEKGEASPEIPKTWLGMLEQVLAEVNALAEAQKIVELVNIHDKWSERVRIGKEFGLSSKLMDASPSVVARAFEEKLIADEVKNAQERQERGYGGGKTRKVFKEGKKEKATLENAPKIKCFRCQRMGHYANVCSYKTDVNGKTIAANKPSKDYIGAVFSGDGTLSGKGPTRDPLKRAFGKHFKKRGGANSDWWRPSVENSRAERPKVEESGRLYDQKDVLLELEIPPESQPIMEGNSRLSREQEDFAIGKIRELAEAGVCIPSESTWNSPIVVAGKKGPEKFRLCVDYRSLNAITRDLDQFIPDIRNLVDRTRGFKKFAKIDYKAAYYRIMVAILSQKYLAFTSPDGTKWTWSRMPFGVKDGPTVFNKWLYKQMNEVISSLAKKGVVVLLYFDDVLICGNSSEDVNEGVRLILERSKAIGLRISDKSILEPCDEIDYVGFRIGGGRIGVPKEKLEKISQKILTVETVKDARKALGSLQHFDLVLKGIQRTKEWLTHVIRGNSSENCPDYVKKEVKAIAGNSTISMEDWPEELDVYFDASDSGWGCSVWKNNKNFMNASGVFSKSEEMRHISRKEALAGVKGLRKVGRFIGTRQILLKTDNQSLYKFLVGKKSDSHVEEFHKLLWWLRAHMPNYKVQWIESAENKADALSRCSLMENVER